MLALAASVPARAQSFWAKAGTSTLMEASGGQVEYKWAPVEGWFSLGSADGFSASGFLGTKIKGYDLGIGDRFMPLVLDTDVLDQSRYFTGRGVSVTRLGERQRWTVFAGATTGDRSFPFVQSFTTDEATGAIFYERKLQRGSEFHSTELFQDGKITAIQSLRFVLTQTLDLRVAGGVGANEHFASIGTEWKRDHIQLLAGYTSAGDNFQRVGGIVYTAPERVGANAQLHLEPFKNFSIRLGHENFLSPLVEKDTIRPRVSLDSVNAGTSIKGFRLGAGYSTSSSGDLHNDSQSYSIARRITGSINATGSMIKMNSESGKTTMYISTVQERISPRLSLQQGITRVNGANSLSWGGHFLSNRFTIGLQHDLYYTPLAGGYGGKTHSQVWSINLGLNLFRSVRVHMDTFVDPRGKVRYSTWADGIGFGRNAEEEFGHASPIIGNFAKFLVSGIVVDTNNQPVWGINVQVDGQNTFTDRNGRFFLRFRKGMQYPVQVLTSQSLNSQAYEVVEAPVSALAESEGDARPVRIVLRPVFAPKVPTR